MDILTHIITGAGVAATSFHFSDKYTGVKWKLIILGALTGATPDIDALSMWKYCDATIGALFGLKQPGHVIYVDKLWYSHHAFFHSFLAASIWACFIALFPRIVKLIKNDRLGIPNEEHKRVRFVFVTILIAYSTHLLEDMITPIGSWNGVRIFFPLKMYIGGWGFVWWWNNYDMFISICIFLLLRIISLKLVYRSKVGKNIAISLVITALTTNMFLVNLREYNYNSKRNNQYAELENKSKNEQRKILGNKIYRFMCYVDKVIPGNF